jgi:cytochrome c oxidase assembly protein subunit 15
MKSAEKSRSSRPVAIWLLVGVGMIMIQVLLGGITRLTGSGLSITEWKPILGALPPMNEQQWLEAFEKYKQIAQYKFLNFHFSLQDFKFIYFWEWFHRLWARLIGVVFLIPFAVFLYQKRIKKEMVKPLLIMFLLGALQGLIGWIMVQSGLGDSENIYVSHYRLAIHFILALVLLCYVLWFALYLLVPRTQLVFNKPLRKFTVWLMVLLGIQFIYGAFMAGLKAATSAPTWPTINGVWMPENFHAHAGQEFAGLSFLADHPLVVHFIHRNLAYLLVILVFIWFLRALKIHGSSLLNRIKWLPLFFVLLQTALGIWTVLHAADARSLLWLGTAHQFVAMLLLLSLFCILYLLRRRQPVDPV